METYLFRHQHLPPHPQMGPGPIVPGSGDQCLWWDKLQNITIEGSLEGQGPQPTIDGSGDSGWWDKQYMNDRPTLFGLMWIDGLVIRNLHLNNSAFWTLHPVFSNHILIENLNITTVGPNTDGIDPDSCQDVLLQNCYVSTGDDCIAVKSGKDQDGLKINIPTKDVVVRGKG